MKWIQPVLWKLQSGHGLTNRRFKSSLSKITRPVAAIKSLRFALFIWISPSTWQYSNFDFYTIRIVNVPGLHKLEQLERLRSAAPWLAILSIHIRSQIKTRQSQSYKFKTFAKNYNFVILQNTRHTIWRCLSRCVNMKWIQPVLWKLLSGHDSVHRRTDGQTDARTTWIQYTPFQLHWSGEGVYNNKNKR